MITSEAPELVTFPATVMVTAKDVSYQIIAAFEGGSNYWIDKVECKKGGELATEKPWYADPKVWSGDFLVEIKTEDLDKPFHLTPDRVKTGLAWLAAKHPSRIAEIVGDGDAETADVFLQACMFEDIVYG